MSAGFTHEKAVNETCDWYTPAWVFEAIGLTYDLDPCHPAKRLPWVPAALTYCLADDGLAQPWAGRVWLNPPYGKETPAWLERMHQHRNGVALLHARTDPAWFHAYVAKADAVVFLRRRVRFVDETGNPKPGKDGKVGSPGSGQMLVAWGDECRRALHWAAEVEGLGAYFEGRL